MWEKAIKRRVGDGCKRYSILRNQYLISESKTTHDLGELCNWLVPPQELGRQQLCFGDYLMTLNMTFSRFYAKFGLP